MAPRSLTTWGQKSWPSESDAGAAAAARQELAGKPNVEVVEDPLDGGAAHLGPFDVIVVEGAFRLCPKALLSQLADGGRLVGVDASGVTSQVALYEKSAEGVSRRALFETTAEVLDGFQPGVSFAF